MEERPAAVGALNAPQIDADPLFERIVDLVEIMLEHHVFRRDGRVGFELENPVAVGVLASEQRRLSGLDRAGQAAACENGIGCDAGHILAV